VFSFFRFTINGDLVWDTVKMGFALGSGARTERSASLLGWALSSSLCGKNDRLCARVVRSSLLGVVSRLRPWECWCAVCGLGCFLAFGLVDRAAAILVLTPALPTHTECYSLTCKALSCTAQPHPRKNKISRRFVAASNAGCDRPVETEADVVSRSQT